MAGKVYWGLDHLILYLHRLAVVLAWQAASALSPSYHFATGAQAKSSNR